MTSICVGDISTHSEDFLRINSEEARNVIGAICDRRASNFPGFSASIAQAPLTCSVVEKEGDPKIRAKNGILGRRSQRP